MSGISTLDFLPNKAHLQLVFKEPIRRAMVAHNMKIWKSSNQLPGGNLGYGGRTTEKKETLP